MQLAFSRDELLSEHAYHRPHVIRGRAFHGGFDADGRYLSPRSKRRIEAIHGWSRALRVRGGEPHAIDFDPLEGDRYPNPAQLGHLLRTGHDDVFWDLLTQVGRAEAQGRALLALQPPDFAKALADDTREWAVGHLGGGLLEAHGLDEAGNPAGGPGGHDRMWVMARDLSLGDGKHPTPAERERAPARTPTRRISEIPEAQEQFIRFLMILLVIETRALPFIQAVRELLVDPELFADRASQAQEAAELVGRIGQDEAIHVSGLRVVLGELYHATFVTPDGPQSGRQLFTQVWPLHVEFLNRTAPRFDARRLRGEISERVGARPGGRRVLEELAALESRP